MTMTPERLTEWRRIAKSPMQSYPNRTSILRSELAELIDEVDAARDIDRVVEEWRAS